MSEFNHTKVAALTNFSLNRKVTVLVLFLTILVVGAVATTGIPLELLPSGFTGSSLRVVTPWRDSPSVEVLEKITKPLEDELSTVRGLNSMSSYSRTGQSFVNLRFKQGVDMDVAYREVRDRVERARATFPDGVDRVFIRKEDTSGIPVAVIGIALDPEVTDAYNLLQEHVVKPLERIDGVASVKADGMTEKEVIIEVDRFKADAAGLNLYQLSQDLGGDNFTMASGHIRDSGKKFLLRSLARYETLEELENRILKGSVRLKDVAQVRYTAPERPWEVRVNGLPAVAFNIMKEGEANTVEVSRRIQSVFEEIQGNPLFKDAFFENLFNQGTVVEGAIATLTDSGKLGGVLAGIVLFLFLRRFRLTVIISLSIPLSLLIALAVMYFAGETLNLLSILALVICVGLLVDNSVVVAENIHRLHKQGVPRREACVRGASDIALAIVMATLTTVVVFLPVALVEGQGQFFLMRMALPISVSLIASLFVALIFIPLCVYITLPVSQKKRENAWTRFHDKLNWLLRSAYDAIFLRLNRRYNVALGYFLRGHRLDLVVLVTAIFVITMTVASEKVSFVESQDEDKASFQISARLGTEYSREDVRKFFSQAEQVLKNKEEELGLDGFLVVNWPSGGFVEAWLKKDRPDKRKASEIARDVMDLMPQWAGVRLYTDDENQVEEAKGEAVHVIRLQGEDPDLLEKIATDLEPQFMNVPGVLGIKKSGEDTPNEMALMIDRDRAKAAGVQPNFIAGMVAYALQGSPLPRYNENGKEIPVRIRYQESDRESLQDLENFYVPTDSGDVVAVSSLTNSKMLSSARGIFRREKQIMRTITIEIEEERSMEVRSALMDMQKRIDLPEGIQFTNTFGGMANDDLKNMIMALFLSIMFIYLLMGFLFESFMLPLSIIVTIPLAIVGVYWGHMAFGLNLDFLGMVGMILLVGVVVNNGIVLIDRINGLRARGVDRLTAILQAAEQRFQPIAMTALTTIIGMIPLAVSEPQAVAFGEGFSYKSFGVALIGGMTTATMLTLLVVPVLYSLFDDAREYLSGVAGRIFFGGESGDDNTLAQTTHAS